MEPGGFQIFLVVIVKRMGFVLVETSQTRIGWLLKVHTLVVNFLP